MTIVNCRLRGRVARLELMVRSGGLGMAMAMSQPTVTHTLNVMASMQDLQPYWWDYLVMGIGIFIRWQIVLCLVVGLASGIGLMG